MSVAQSIKVFISSTFSDFSDERKVLHETVFPELARLCRQAGFDFQPVDLRWGVSEEAALTHRTMELCEEEVDRCINESPRPNFLLLLGDRYGWQPLQARIEAAEFSLLHEAIRQSDPRDADMLEQWYAIEQNDVPASYRLRGRWGAAEDDVAWAGIEARLCAMLQRAARKVLPAQRSAEYFLSATHREIIRGLGQTDNYLIVDRRIDNLAESPRRAQFQDSDQDCVERMQGLRLELASRDAERVLRFGVRLAETEGFSGDYLEQFAAHVLARLTELVAATLAEATRMAPFDREEAGHQAFRQRLLEDARRRPDEERRILSLLEQADSNSPIAILGDSGAGKSVLMSQLAQQFSAQGITVIMRFVGATPASRNPASLSSNLVDAVARHLGLDDRSFEATRLETVLRHVPAGRTLVIMVDALDQLAGDEAARSLDWLPLRLPVNVHLIVSSAHGETSDILQELLGPRCVSMEKITRTEAQAIVDQWLAFESRRLTPAQNALLLADIEQRASQLLFLRLSFALAQTWSSSDTGFAMPDDVGGLIRACMSNYAHRLHHGEKLVQRAFEYLALARDGLGEAELLGLLYEDEDVRAEYRRRYSRSPQIDGLPWIVWSRLKSDISSFLTQRDVDGKLLYSFIHRSISEHIVQNMADDERQWRHAALARYFSCLPRQPVWLSPANSSYPNRRRLREESHHLARVGQPGLARLAIALSDFDYVAAKCAAGLLDDLLIDFNALGALPPSRRAGWEAAAAFVREHAQLLRHSRDDWPAHRILLQIALEQNPGRPIRAQAEQWLKSGRVDWLWWRSIWDIPSLQGTTWMGAGVSLSYGIRALDEQRSLVVYRNGNLQIIDTETGRPIHFLVAHAEEINGFVQLGAGQLLTWDGDGRAIKWGLRSGRALMEILAHDGPIDSAGVFRDGRMYTLSTKLGELKIWDEDRCEATLIIDTQFRAPHGGWRIEKSSRFCRIARATELSAQPHELFPGLDLSASGFSIFLGSGSRAIDDDYVLTWGWTGAAVWRISEGKKVGQLSFIGDTIKFAIHSGHHQVVILTSATVMYRWHIDSGELFEVQACPQAAVDTQVAGTRAGSTLLSNNEIFAWREAGEHTVHYSRICALTAKLLQTGSLASSSGSLDGYFRGAQSSMPRGIEVLTDSQFLAWHAEGFQLCDFNTGDITHLDSWSVITDRWQHYITSCVALSPELVIVCSQGRLQPYNPRSGTWAREIDEWFGEPVSVRPVSRNVIEVLTESSVWRWDCCKLIEGESLHTLAHAGVGPTRAKKAVIDDSSTLYTLAGHLGSIGTELMAWDIERGSMITRLPSHLLRHDSSVHTVSTDMLVLDSWLVSWGDDNVLRMFNRISDQRFELAVTRTTKIKRVLRVTGAAPADGIPGLPRKESLLAVALENGSVYVFPLQSSHPRMHVDLPASFATDLADVDYASLGEEVLLARTRHVMCGWNISSVATGAAPSWLIDVREQPFLQNSAPEALALQGDVHETAAGQLAFTIRRKAGGEESDTWMTENWLHDLPTATTRMVDAGDAPVEPVALVAERRPRIEALRTEVACGTAVVPWYCMHTPEHIGFTPSGRLVMHLPTQAVVALQLWQGDGPVTAHQASTLLGLGQPTPETRFAETLEECNRCLRAFRLEKVASLLHRAETLLQAFQASAVQRIRLAAERSRFQLYTGKRAEALTELDAILDLCDEHQPEELPPTLMQDVHALVLQGISHGENLDALENYLLNVEWVDVASALAFDRQGYFSGLVNHHLNAINVNRAHKQEDYAARASEIACNLMRFALARTNDTRWAARLGQLQAATAKAIGTSRPDVATIANERSRVPQALLPLFDQAVGGERQAMLELGMAYGRGSTDHAPVPVLAAYWYEKAATLGDLDSAFCLSQMYRGRDLGEPDLDKAAYWLTLPAQAGVSKAQTNLGGLYLTRGDGYLGLARHWLEKGLAGGDAIAGINLAVMYWLGAGVPKNLDKAVEYLQPAMDLKSADAFRLFSHIQKDLQTKVPELD